MVSCRSVCRLGRRALGGDGGVFPYVSASALGPFKRHGVGDAKIKGEVVKIKREVVEIKRAIVEIKRGIVKIKRALVKGGWGKKITSAVGGCRLVSVGVSSAGLFPPSAVIMSFCS